MFNAKRLSGWMALAVFATVGGAMVAADPAFAKVDVDKLTIDGEARTRYEVRTNAAFLNTAAGKANESAASSRIRVGFGYDLTPDVSFYAQLQDARVWGSECNVAGCNGATTGIGTVSSTNQNSTGVDLHQGYIQLKNVLVPGLGLKIGRQELFYGDHRLLGNFNWSQVGNSFDAAKVLWQSEMVDVDLFWARIADTEATATNQGVIFPGGGSTATTDQDLYGAYVTLKPVKGWTIEPYYFLLEDHRLATARTAAVAGTSSLINPQAADQNRSYLGGRINGKTGGLDLTLEANWQFGAIASGGASTGNDENLRINAQQEAARIGYTFEPVPMKPRIGVEVDYASGDKCANAPAGNTGCGGTNLGHFNTADNLYPTNHFHYGYMDLASWKNMVAYSGVFDVKPTDKSKLQFNFMLLRLARTTDNWYRAGQTAYVVTGASNQAASLGKELDIHYWHTFKEKFLFEIGWGHFWAGEILKNNPNLSNGSGAVASIDGVTVGPGTTNNSTNNIVGQTWGYVMASVKF